MKALNKINVTRYHPTHPGILWLVDNGYVFEVTENSVFLVRAL